MKRQPVSILHALFITTMVLLFTSCSSIKPVAITGVKNFRTGNNPAKPEFTFDLGISNPNNFGVTVQRMGVNVYVGDSAIAGVNIPGKTKITRNEKIQVPVTIKPSLQTLTGILMAGVTSLFSNVKDQEMEIKGEIVIRKFIFTRKIKIREAIKMKG